MSAIHPYGARIAVRIVQETVTAGGIVIPETADKERPQRAEVVAVGPGQRLDNGSYAKMGIALGDVVLFGKYSGTEFELEDGQYLILKEDDIMAVVKD